MSVSCKSINETAPTLLSTSHSFYSSIEKKKSRVHESEENIQNYCISDHPNRNTAYINTTFTVTFARSLSNSGGDNDNGAISIRDAAVAILHDHPSVLTLGPLVTRYERVVDDDDGANASSSARSAASSNSNKETYLVWETISYLPGTHLWDAELEIKAEFEDTPDGTRAEVTAPLGFRSCFEWKIVKEDSTNGGWRAEESVTAACPWGLRWFVEGTMRKAHEVIVERFVERVGEALK